MYLWCHFGHFCHHWPPFSKPNSRSTVFSSINPTEYNDAKVSIFRSEVIEITVAHGCCLNLCWSTEHPYLLTFVFFRLSFDMHLCNHALLHCSAFSPLFSYICTILLSVCSNSYKCHDLWPPLLSSCLGGLSSHFGTSIYTGRLGKRTFTSYLFVPYS